MVEQNYSISTVKNTVPPKVKMSQYDTGSRTITFSVVDGSGASVDLTGKNVTVEGTRIDGHAFVVACTVSGSEVTFVETVDITNEAGDHAAELVIRENGQRLGTMNFVIAVEAAAMDENASITPEDESLFNQLFGSVDDAIEEVDTAKDAALQEIAQGLASGSPLIANTVAEMTDTDEVYLYTGSESGYTKGSWYYYNGTAWTEGGIYGNGTTDTTLTLSGTAADAKATGEAVDEVKSTLNGYVYGVNQTFTHTGSTGWDYFRCLLLEGAEYTITNNNADHVMQARIYREDNSRIEIGTVPAGGTLKFIVPSDEFVRVGGYMYNGASFTITSNYSDYKAPVELADGIKHMKEDLYSGAWTQGSLNSGVETSSTYRIRTDYIFVPVGSHVTISVQSGFSYEIDYYNSEKVYQKDEGWLTAERLVQSSEDIYIRILLRYTSNNVSITPDKYTNISILKAWPLLNIVKKVEGALNGTKYLPTEMGSIIGGKPSANTNYFRTKGYTWANKGDILTLSPIDNSVTYGCIYMYSTDDTSGYYSDVDIPTTAAGSSYSYTFTQDCFFRARGNLGKSVTPSDLYLTDTFYRIDQMCNLKVERKSQTFAVDIDTLNASLSGKFNIALQTDTHMSGYVGYSTQQYGESDYYMLQKVVNTINKINVNLFANLGDFIRGYAFDPDFQTRESIDMMMEQYKQIATNKAFVIGNHDDGCMYYYGTYNDNQNTQNVLFPNEQFNRYIKFGLNNMGSNNYYYADVDGVRIITLYQRDFDYSTAIPNIEEFKIGTDQLSWLSNTALDTTLPVIILTHAPLEATLYSTSRTGFDEALAAIKAFKNNGGTVIAILSGHTHAQGAEVVDGIPNIVFANGYTWFELVSVDLTARSITCKAVNAAFSEMTFSY